MWKKDKYDEIKEEGKGTAKDRELSKKLAKESAAEILDKISL